MRFWLCLAALVVTFALCAETKVVFVADDIVRVVKSPTGADPVKRVPVVVLKPTVVQLEERSADGQRTWKSASLLVTLDEASGRVSFSDAAGNPLLSENAGVKFTTVRESSVVPYGPDVQYAAEKPWDALEVVVYPGADGSFVLYEDTGDGYGYEKGEFTEIPMRWDEG